MMNKIINMMKMEIKIIKEKMIIIMIKIKNGVSLCI